jgi:hypothetical protein
MQQAGTLNGAGTMRPIADVVVYAWPAICPRAVSQTYAAILTGSDGDRTGHH